jgi:hypothetical protein
MTLPDDLIDHPNISYVNTWDGRDSGWHSYPTSITALAEVEKLRSDDEILHILMQLDPDVRKLLLMRQAFIRESDPSNQALDQTAIWIASQELLWILLGRPAVHIESEELVNQLYAMKSSNGPIEFCDVTASFEIYTPYGMVLDRSPVKPMLVEYIGNDDRMQLHQNYAAALSGRLNLPPGGGLKPLEVYFNDEDYPDDNMWALSWLETPKAGGCRVRTALPATLVPQAVMSERDFVGCIKAFHHPGEELIVDADDQISYRLTRVAYNLLTYINQHPDRLVAGGPLGHARHHELMWTVRADSP